jgi:hypothetical protein
METKGKYYHNGTRLWEMNTDYRPSKLWTTTSLRQWDAISTDHFTEEWIYYKEYIETKTEEAKEKRFTVIVKEIK